MPPALLNLGSIQSVYLSLEVPSHINRCTLLATFQTQRCSEYFDDSHLSRENFIPAPKFEDFVSC